MENKEINENKSRKEFKKRMTDDLRDYFSMYENNVRCKALDLFHTSLISIGDLIFIMRREFFFGKKECCLCDKPIAERIIYKEQLVSGDAIPTSAHCTCVSIICSRVPFRIMNDDVASWDLDDFLMINDVRIEAVEDLIQENDDTLVK